MTDRLGYHRYRLPFCRAGRTAHGVWAAREGLLVRVEDPTGRIGFGEVAPIPWLGTETLAEAEATLGGLGGIVEAASLEDIDERYGCVRFALASALSLGPGGPPTVPRLPVAALLPAGREALAETDRARNDGYEVFKWKVGVFAVADELAMLDDLLARLPVNGKLRLDANGAWTTRQAARWLDCCAERPIEFVEQPCFAETAQGAAGQRRTNDVLVGLARDYPTPIALDESVTGVRSLQAWLERGWPGIVVVKPALAGAPGRVLELLATHKADVVYSSALETVVARHMALRMAFRFPGRQGRALGFGVLPLFQDVRFDGMPAAPFVAAGDVDRMDLESAWNALN